MQMPTAADLGTLQDGELLDLLDLVSDEVKRRNGLRPATAGKAAVDVMKILSEMAAVAKR
jgi:hypothetical protein